MKSKQKMFMKIFIKNKTLIDFRDYTLDSKFYDLVNEKVISKMTDGFIGKITDECAGLNSKIYSLITVDDE